MIKDMLWLLKGVAGALSVLLALWFMWCLFCWLLDGTTYVFFHLLR